MIEYLNVSYTANGINVMLSVDVHDENICYNLAELFTRIIKETNANDEKVIEQLKDNLGL